MYITMVYILTEENAMDNSEKTLDQLVALCKGRGFVYPGSEIYGGLANTWDYGPLGVELKENIKKAWRKKFIQENQYNVGLDSAILMNPQTWVASGHLGGFSDPLMDCCECKTRHRADDLIESFDGTNVAGWSNEEMAAYIKEHNIPCPNCGAHNFTDIRQFNLMFKTFQGVTEDAKDEIYLRPETAQGIFVNFANVQRTTRKKIPFGVAQVGKSFRNEITPGKFIFRVREFEQMELEFFCKPGTDLEWFDYWRSFCRDWLYSLNISKDNLRLRDHDQEELCFYSKATTDFEYKFPFGWGELWGVADRTDYDLTQHIKTSGKNLEYFDQATGEKYVPYVMSRHSVLSVYSWHFLPKLMTRRFLTKKRTTRELLCTSTLLLRRLRLRFFRFQKSLTSRQAKFMQCFLKNSTLTMMTPALSARDIAVRTKSVLLTA